MKFPGGREKAFTLSYDDGIRQDKKLVGIFNKYGLKCTFNINSGLTGDESQSDKPDGRMSWKEMKATYAGHEIALHALTHPFLEQLTPAQATTEVISDRLNIEKELGVITRGMAYPYGTYNDTVVEILKNSGIAYCRTTHATNGFGLPQNWLTLYPTTHHANPKLFELIDAFTKDEHRTNPVPMMFYLWGHSYEFDRNDEYSNWERAEQFCEKLAGHEDKIWYATNIEIYDYTMQFNRLIFSADGSIVYNPTSTELYFAAGIGGRYKDYCISAGETLKI